MQRTLGHLLCVVRQLLVAKIGGLLVQWFRLGHAYSLVVQTIAAIFLCQLSSLAIVTVGIVGWVRVEG